MSITDVMLDIEEKDNLSFMINSEGTIINGGEMISLTYLDDGYVDTTSDEEYSDEEYSDEDDNLNEEKEESNKEVVINTAKKSIVCRRCKLPSNMRRIRSRR